MAVTVAPWLTRLLADYSARLAAGRMHHGILLSGSHGIGVTPFARALAARMLCQQPTQDGRCGACQSCQLYDAGTHPDLYTIESEKQIGVDQIREGIRSLTGTAQLSGNKVLILKAAHTLTEAAANALLKTLEEPTIHTYLVLTVEKPSQLLPTILSRCEKTALPLPSLEHTRFWLESHGIAELPPLLLHLYAQQPYTLLDIVQADEKYSPVSFYAALRAMTESEHNAAGVAEKWQVHSASCVDWLMSFTRLTVSNSPAPDDLNWQFYQRCIEAKKKLMNPGINKALVLQPLLDCLDRYPDLLPKESHFAG